VKLRSSGFPSRAIFVHGLVMSRRRESCSGVYRIQRFRFDAFLLLYIGHALEVRDLVAMESWMPWEGVTQVLGSARASLND
jgi:hypothetical protein